MSKIEVNYAETREHLVKDGETWDRIAWTWYGDAAAMEPIIRANPHVPIRPVIAPGTVLQIPVLSSSQAARPGPGAPPWKRG